MIHVLIIILRIVIAKHTVSWLACRASLRPITFIYIYIYIHTYTHITHMYIYIYIYTRICKRMILHKQIMHK